MIGCHYPIGTMSENRRFFHCAISNSRATKGLCANSHSLIAAECATYTANQRTLATAADETMPLVSCHSLSVAEHGLHFRLNEDEEDTLHSTRCASRRIRCGSADARNDHVVSGSRRNGRS